MGNLCKIDPMALKALYWPDVKLYSKQIELVYSVEECPETICVAGNGWPLLLR